MNKKVKKIIFFSALIWTVINFHHPVTPTHFTNLGLPDHVFGTSYGAMVFSMFLTSPIWGSIGDRGYRIKGLAVSTMLYGFIQIGLGFMTSLGGVILMRALAGTMTSGFHVGIMSALVDECEPEDKGIIMAKYSAIMSVCTALGFLIGGVIGYLPTIMTFLIQGISIIIISILIRLTVEETKPRNLSEGKKTVFIWDLFKDIKDSKEIFTPWIIIFLGITFFLGIAYSGNNNAFNYYLKAELDLVPIVNGIWKALVGIIGLVANLSLNVWLVNRTNIKKSMLYILFMGSFFGFSLYFVENIYLFFFSSLMFFTAYTIQVPILQVFAVDESKQGVGFMAGLFNAFRSLGMMIGAIAAGFSYEISSKFPFILGALAFFTALVLGLVNYYFFEREEKISL